MYDSLKPVVLTGNLKGNFLASCASPPLRARRHELTRRLAVALGWGVTTGAGIASYPLDTIRRRMMMTSGEKVHYNGMVDCGKQIIKAEGVASLFKGAGANILRGVAGAGVLSMYDKLQELLFGKVVSRRSLASSRTPHRHPCHRRRSIFPRLDLVLTSPPLFPVQWRLGVDFREETHRKLCSLSVGCKDLAPSISSAREGHAREFASPEGTRATCALSRFSQMAWARSL